MNVMPYYAILKAGSKSDTRPCVALIRKMQKIITKKVGGFLTTRRKNATQGNARIGSESILASCCVSTSVDNTCNVTHCLASYYEPAFSNKFVRFAN